MQCIYFCMPTSNVISFVILDESLSCLDHYYPIVYKHDKIRDNTKQDKVIKFCNSQIPLQENTQNHQHQTFCSNGNNKQQQQKRYTLGVLFFKKNTPG